LCKAQRKAGCFAGFIGPAGKADMPGKRAAAGRFE
jgi:hypothetical protein